MFLLTFLSWSAQCSCLAPLPVLVLVLVFLSGLHVHFAVDVCTIFCATIGKQKNCMRLLVHFRLPFPGLDRTAVRSPKDQDRLIRETPTVVSLGFDSGIRRSVGQICLRTATELGTASLVFDADPCLCIGRWVPSLMVEFAGPRHHLAYRLGTSSRRGQERAPENAAVPYPTTHYLTIL